MAEIHELMLAGVPARLARMLGQYRVRSVAAAGSSAEDATELTTNFCVVTTSGLGQGISLDYASGAALTALYNAGPYDALIYPAPDDSFNNQAPDLPVTLPVGVTMFAVPSAQSWMVTTGGGIGDAPFDGGVYGRQNGMWAPVDAGGAATAPMWVTLPGSYTVTPGISRIYVNATGNVALTLPPNDVVVLDRGGNAGTYPITCYPPAGNINGNPSFVMVGAWRAAGFVWDGANFALGPVSDAVVDAPPSWVTTGGTTAVIPGVDRVFVDVAAMVTLALPPNDILVADRGGNAAGFPITCQPPAGATINGNPGYVILEPWGLAQFLWDGTGFGIAYNAGLS